VKYLIPYVEYLKSLGHAEGTWLGHRYRLKQFKKACGIKDERLIRRKDIEEYRESLKERNLVQGTINMHIGSIKKYFNYLVRYGYLFTSPAEKIELVKEKRSRPRDILTLHEIDRLLKSPGKTLKGKRDRAILEVMYSTAIRSKELCGLNVSDLNLKDHEIHIRNTKTRQERIVPLGKQAQKTLEFYLKIIRPRLQKIELEQAVFLSMIYGRRLACKDIATLLRKYVKQAGIVTRITPHCLRHSCATHMLQNGAPVEIIQRILGHEHIESTEVYTRVLGWDLKGVVQKTHPGRNKKTL